MDKNALDRLIELCNEHVEDDDFLYRSIKMLIKAKNENEINYFIENTRCRSYPHVMKMIEIELEKLRQNKENDEK